MNNTIAFLDSITNPFGATASAQVPDRYSGNTICLTDWTDETPVIGGALATNFNANCWMLLPSYSQLKTSNASNPNQQYQLVSFPLDVNYLISTTAAGKLTSATTQNIGVITGNATSYDVDDCLVDAYRVFGAGLRAWPLIETVTDTSSFHITRFFGGLISPNTVLRSIVDATNFLNVIRNIDNVKEYAGYEGCTVRYNPFITEYQLNMISLAAHNVSSIDYSGIEVPIICAVFSQTAVSTASTGCMVQSRWWLEGQISLPSPIYATASPIDLSYDKISQVMSRPSNDYPITVAGHSFLAFTAGLISIASLVRAAIRTAAVVDTALDIATTNRGTRKQQRRRPKGKRNNPKRNRNGKKNASNQIVKPVRPMPKSRQVRNTRK